MILIPGVIETTSNFVEHPEVVARRIEEAVAAVGDRERVIASTDCGFGTFTSREWVIEPVVWLKLRSLREGADIASARLWGKSAAWLRTRTFGGASAKRCALIRGTTGCVGTRSYNPARLMRIRNALRLPKLRGARHGRDHPRADRHPRRGHQPALQLGPALPAFGTMGVDFEERVDYRRLHRYRLGRVKAALENSDLGALLVFDVNNIRYITSTKIGEWERDKLCRWALLTRTSNDPILWDFGSAAVHHKLYAPWLKPENCKAGLIGMRGTVEPAFGLMKRHAKEIASLIREAGVADMPVGVDHDRAADDVRIAEGRTESRRRPAGDAGGARGQESSTRSRCSIAPPRWSTAPII